MKNKQEVNETEKLRFCPLNEGTWKKSKENKQCVLEDVENEENVAKKKVAKHNRKNNKINTKQKQNPKIKNK